MSKREAPLVWIDLEMTGLDPDRCHVIAIATVVTDGDLNVIGEGPDLVIHASEAELETLSDWSREHFTASGLLDRVRASTVDLQEAQAGTLAFLEAHTRSGASPLCGNSVHTDRAFLLRRMPKLHDFLHYRNVDVSSWKEMLRRWFPVAYAPPAKAGRHEAKADVLESIAELRYYREAFLVPADLPLRFGHLEIPVADAQRSLAFYRDTLGFRLVSEQGPYLWIEQGGMEILLRPDASGEAHGLVWYTENPRAVAADLERRGVTTERRGSCYHLRDPDGHEIQIVNPQDDHSDG